MKKQIIFLFILISFKIEAQQLAPVQPPILSDLPSKIALIDELDFSQEDHRAFAKAYDFFKKEQFESSIAVLQKLKAESYLTPSVYYLLGLNYYRINNYDLAEKYLTVVTTAHNLKEISLAYYYLGLSQYYKADYEKAVTSFELSIDTSIDVEHDKLTEKLIEQCIKIQNQIESDKIKYSLGFSAGYGYDSNVLDVASKADVNNGHTISASGFLAYKYYQNKDSVIEPFVYISDRRTVNHKFEDTSEIQAADATVLLASVPYKKTLDNGYRTSSALNVGMYMMPSNKTNRDLSITLFYFQQTLGSKINDEYELDTKLIIGRDTSQLTFSDAKDNQTAIKYDVSAALRYSMPNFQFFTGEFGFIFNDADGDNASYYKAYSSLVYEKPSFKNTHSNVKLSYGYTNYNLSELGRRDNLAILSYTLSKDLNDHATLNGTLGLSQNNSTIEDYQYSDSFVGLQYTYLTRF